MYGSLPPTLLSVTRVTRPSDFAHTRTLFEAYAASLSVSLDFQNFTMELETLGSRTSAYGPPGGGIWLAWGLPHEPLGVVALRSLPHLGPEICEMKRLYVNPAARGLGVGRVLIKKVIEEACLRGYKAMMLDTLSTMTAARRLYEEAGFGECERYYGNEYEGVVFMRLDLGRVVLDSEAVWRVYGAFGGE
ncbi:putative N-acetyltransferase [Patellaria atrata CBS 101060]|uniref:N-acetyltransferase n=1 Tax=Patellaria atrata CBS 101060 TaxID=1346257 RepID=A0A9P4S8G5_9PEZI|nr:putative N-acetyltransferase [Patellaria atrata CBS 101060]